MNLSIRGVDRESHTCCFRLCCRDCRTRSPIFLLRLMEAQEFITLHFENRVPKRQNNRSCWPFRLLVFQGLRSQSALQACLGRKSHTRDINVWNLSSEIIHQSAFVQWRSDVKGIMRHMAFTQCNLLPAGSSLHFLFTLFSFIALS